MNGRTARLQVHYNNKDISADVQNHLKSWSYTDNLSGQADDLQISLEDREQLWIGDWMPETGATLKSKLIRDSWDEVGKTDELSLGSFEIDDIEPSGPPSIVTIKGLSIPESSSLRGEEKNRAWEKSKLSIISRDIASSNGMKLFYDTDDDPDYDRMEQASEKDLSFLMRLCADAGLCLKIADGQIIIFDERKYEDQAPITTIKRTDKTVISYSGRTSLNGLYKSCKVEYHDPNKDTTIKFEYKPPHPPKTGRVLIVTDRVASTKEAERLAKKRLRQENKNAVTFSLSLWGDIRYVAGVTINLQEFGFFNGKYIVFQATHGQSSAYETKLQLRKCLEGY